MKRGVKGGKCKKRSKMGDGLLFNEVGILVEILVDVNNFMVVKCVLVVFFKYVNYEVLVKVYGEESVVISRVVSEVLELF